MVETPPYVAPEPVVIVEPTPVYKKKPDWLSSWATTLGNAVPAPTLTSIEPVKTAETGGTYYSGYKRSWKKPVNKKPAPAPYTSYKPVVVEPKKYSTPVVEYKREPVKVIEKPKRRPYRRRNRHGYENYNDDNYLTTYSNRYNGTKAKPHSHASCLERMLAKF